MASSFQPAPILLRRMLPEATGFAADLSVSHATDRSSDCRPGSLFAVIRGAKADGRNYIADAIAQGAAVLLIEESLSEVRIPQVIVPNVRAAYAQVCAALADNPSERLNVVGITGTNGKTTVTWLIRAILQQAGQRCGLLGTIEYSDGVQAAQSSLTTPDPQSFSVWLARMVAGDATCAACEISSHALDQDRVAGAQLAAAVVTNITQDHFDYHGDFAHYRASKAKIAGLLRANAALILNRDDPVSWGVRQLVDAGVPITTFSHAQHADVSARIISESLDGMVFRLDVRGEAIECRSSLIGRHNLENCLAAAAACANLGVSITDIAQAIRSFRGAPGRLERIACGQPFEVFVDYAHTDDALRRCLECLRSITPGRVICVFGAGGDRDRTKRPLLGKASQLADISIVTSDNPRSEPPAQIAADIVAGFTDAGPSPLVELDRRTAIRRAVRSARPGDSVLIAGKGHECEQIFRQHRIAFDDRQQARQALMEHLAANPIFETRHAPRVA